MRGHPHSLRNCLLLIPLSSEFLSPSLLAGNGGGGRILAGQNLVVYVDIAGVAVFDFRTGRLGIVDMVNMALLRAKTFAHMKKMPVLQAMGGQRGGLWLFYTVNLVYSESGNTFSPEKEENILTLYNNDIHKIHCYVKYFILVKS